MERAVEQTGVGGRGDHRHGVAIRRRRSNQEAIGTEPIDGCGPAERGHGGRARRRADEQVARAHGAVEDRFAAEQPGEAASQLGFDDPPGGGIGRDADRRDGVAIRAEAVGVGDHVIAQPQPRPGFRPRARRGGETGQQDQQREQPDGRVGS